MKQRLFLSNLSLSRFFSALSEIIYLLIILLIPIWFSFIVPTFNVFELSKLLLFRYLLAVFTISLFLYLLKEGNAKKIFYILRAKSKGTIASLLWPAVLLIIVLSALLFFSSNPVQSFWGSYTRQQGFFSYLMYFWWALLLFFYLIAQFLLRGEKVYRLKIKRIILVIASSGTLVAIYGILQILNIDVYIWPEAPYLTGRALSSLGQPNFLASFLLFTIPLSFYLFTSHRKIWLKYLFFLSGFLQLLCLYFTSSRGAILALIATLGLFTIKLIFSAKLIRRQKAVLILALFSFSFLSLVLINILIPGRMSSALDIKAGSSAARVTFFQSAANAILEKPLLGYGLESSKEVFITYYERDWGLHGPVGANADRAHNIILDILLSTGFLGLLAFSLWYYSYFKLGFSFNKDNYRHPLAQALVFSSFAYFLSLFFSFTIVAGEIYFWLFFSLLASLFFTQKHQDLAKSAKSINENWTNKEKIFSQFIVILLIFLSLWSLINTLKTSSSDQYLLKSEVAINSQEFILALELRKMIVNLNASPILVDEANHYVGTKLTEYCNYASFRDRVEEVIVKNDLADIANNLSEYTYDNIFLKAKIYSCLGERDLALSYYDKVAKVGVNWPNNYLEWGRLYAQENNIAQAIKYFNLVEINLPDPSSPLINDEHRKDVYRFKYIMYKSLAEAYMRNNNYQQAEKFFQLAFHNFPSDFTLLKKIADCHYLMGDKERALSYNLHGLELNPSDYNWSLIVSILYSELGKQDKALFYIDRALSLAPSDKQEDLNAILKNY